MATTEASPAAPRFTPESIGIAAVLVGTVLFSLKPILIKLAYAGGVTPEGLIGLRMLISLPFYAVIGLLAFRRRGWRARAGLVAGAALAGMFGFYVAAYLDLLALTHISSQLERIVLFTYPTWVIVFGALFLGETITRRKLAALGLAYLGVVIVVGHDLAAVGDRVALGIGLALATTLVYAGYLIVAKRGIEALGTGLFTSIAMGSASFMIAAHLGATGSFGDLSVPAGMYVLVAALAIGATVAPSYLINAGVARIGVGPTAIVSTVGPAVTSVFAVLVLGERFTPYHLAGLALTGAGIVVLTWTGNAVRARASGP